MASIENETREEYSGSKAWGGGGEALTGLWKERLQVTVLGAMLRVCNGFKYTKSEVFRKLTTALAGAI